MFKNIDVVILVIGISIFIIRLILQIRRDKFDELMENNFKPKLKIQKKILKFYMDSNKFWSLIESSRGESENNYKKQCKILFKKLINEENSEIVKFENTFLRHIDDLYDWKLWAAAFIINKGCSDDGFMDFRSWLISLGKTTFDKALQNPEFLATIEIRTKNWEGIQYCAGDAYSFKNKTTMPITLIQRKEFISGEEWNENDLKKILPELFVKYWRKK